MRLTAKRRDAARSALGTALARALLAGLLFLAAGCEPVETESARGAAPADATRQLDTLVVSAWGSMAGYRRDRFRHWSSQQNGCDTRDVVLQRDGTDVRTDEDCKITGGTWVSPYDGKVVTDPSDIDIDHLVPLANAWRTGAREWTDEQRAAFANDLVRPQLIAVSASSNRAKGDQDPSQWRPPRREYWCTYARDWVAVKSYWRLSVTEAEKLALKEMLETCP